VPYEPATTPDLPYIGYCLLIGLLGSLPALLMWTLGVSPRSQDGRRLDVRTWRARTANSLLIATILPFAILQLLGLTLACFVLVPWPGGSSLYAALPTVFLLFAASERLTSSFLWLAYSFIALKSRRSTAPLWVFVPMITAPLCWPFAYYYLVHKPRHVETETV